MKEPKCAVCGGKHHKTFCHKAPKKPAKRSSVRSKQKNDKTPIKAKKKPKTRSYYVKRLDSIFSQYIRLRDDGLGCVTCGVIKPWKKMQACHYYSRGRMPTRWDETNVFSGCYRCNVLLKGNYTEYALAMVGKFGVEYVEKLKHKSLSSEKIPTSKLKEMIEYYSLQVESLLIKKSV